MRNCQKCNQETGAGWKTLCRNCWKNQTPDEIRAYRQKKLDKKIARMQTKAEKLTALGDQKQAGLEAYHGDLSFFTQPNINTSGGRRFTKYREKLYARHHEGVRLHREASELEEKATWLEKTGAVVKGDAERKRQALREQLDTVITVGTRVHDFIFNAGEVVRVNKKTYTIRFDSGGTYAREKIFVRLLKE